MIVWHCEKQPVKKIDVASCSSYARLIAVKKHGFSRETFQRQLVFTSYIIAHTVLSHSLNICFSLSVVCGVVNNASSASRTKRASQQKKKVFRLESIFTARASPHTYLKRDFYCSKLRPKWIFRNTYFGDL